MRLVATIEASAAVRRNGGRSSWRTSYDSWLGYVDEIVVGSVEPCLQDGADILLATNALLRLEQQEGLHRLVVAE